MLKNSGRARAVEGLSGLIVLGGGWESPDVFEALGAALDTRDAVTLRFIALLRAQELLENGRTSVAGLTTSSEQVQTYSSEMSEWGIAVNGINQGDLEALFERLRAEADTWNAARQKWMNAKLKTGAHPDEDANFWQGFAETAPPSLEIDWYDWGETVDRSMRFSIAGLCLGGALICGSVLLLRRFYRAKKRRTTT